MTRFVPAMCCEEEYQCFLLMPDNSKAHRAFPQIISTADAVLVPHSLSCLSFPWAHPECCMCHISSVTLGDSSDSIARLSFGAQLSAGHATRINPGACPAGKDKARADCPPSPKNHYKLSYLGLCG